MRSAASLSAFAVTLLTAASAFACPASHSAWPGSPFGYVAVLAVGVLIGAATRVAERFIG